MNKLSDRLVSEAREKLALNVTYIDPKFKEVASWAEELLNAFWVEQQKDLDQIILHTIEQTIKEERWRCKGLVENYLSPEEPERIDDILRDLIDDINDPEQMPIDDDGKIIKESPTPSTLLEG